MSQNALIICRSQTEAIGVRRHLKNMGVYGDITRPTRRYCADSCGFAVRVPGDQLDFCVYRLKQIGISPCHIVRNERLGV